MPRSRASVTAFAILVVANRAIDFDWLGFARLFGFQFAVLD